MEPFINISDIGSLSRQDFENTCVRNTKSTYLGDHVVLCTILTKYKLYVDTRDRGISPHLIMDGFWESWLTQCLARITKPGDVCIDIGANFGYFSVLMSALSGESGRTIAIEPNPGLCKLLNATAYIHPFEVQQIAVSNKDGKAVLTIPEESFGDASIIARKDRIIRRRTKIKVATKKLDSLARELNLPKVDVIKIDVEGVEPLVFQGMGNIIANNPGLRIILEYSPYMYQDAKKFTEYLFSNFIVTRIKDVDGVQSLTEESIPELLQLKDHTDLFLERK
jgi:FkbM family methyltransferase